MSQIDRRVGLIGNAAVKVPVKAATTANITLSGEQTIDGVSVVSGDRVLVKDQTDATENGLYTTDTGTWSRTPDWNGPHDVVRGTMVFVNQGTNAGFYRVTTANTITIGTTSVSLTRLPPVLGDNGVFTTASLTTLKAVEISGLLEGDTLYLLGRTTAGDGGQGFFRWDASDQSANVSADTQSGVYVPPDSDATGASGAWVRQYSGALFDKWFGTVNDGSTVDDTALAGAITFLTHEIVGTQDGDPVRELRISEGVSRLTTSGILSSLADSTRGGYVISGAGSQTSILWLDTSDNAEKWFYDNGATLRTFNSTFKHLCFAGGTTWRTKGLDFTHFSSFANGFKHTGPGWESGHKFIDCEFRWLNTVHHLAGSNNVDTHRDIACYYIKCKHLWHIDNLQSFSVTAVQPYVDVLYGNVLTYGSNVNGGGGNFAIYGGDIVLQPDQGDESRTWIVDASDGGPAAANAPIAFHGTRFELHGEAASIADATFGSVMHVQFDGCSFLNDSTADKPGVNVNGNATVSFSKSSFSSSSTGRFTWTLDGTTAGRKGKNAWLMFEKCDLDAEFHDKVTWISGHGRLTVENCYGAIADATAEPQIIAYDCDIFGTTWENNTAARGSKLKVVGLKRNDLQPDDPGIVLQLPPYSIIKAVYAKLAAGQGVAQNIQYHITNGDETVEYAASTSAGQNVGHEAFNDHVFVNVEEDSNTRLVRILVDDGAGGAPHGTTSTTPPDVAVVEYY